MKTWLRGVVYVAASVAIVAGCKKGQDLFAEMIPETDDEPTTAQVQGYVFQPALVAATDANIQQLKAPAGFKVTKFADGLGKPRMVAVSPAGHIYVTDREAGTVTMLHDANGDGVADDKKTVLNLKEVHGITIHEGKMYLATVREVYSVSMNGDGTLGDPQRLISNLPDGGQHPNRTLAFGPDNLMYISVGSTCNACDDSNPQSATMLRANPDGSNLTTFAKGLRNTIGFGWHPQTKDMFGLDHGIDWLGDNEQHEEVNQITLGADYGWPYIYDDGQYNPSQRPKGDTTYAQYKQKTTQPVLLYQAHSAPLGMIFYTAGQFPAEYQNDAFVTMRGSWNRQVPSGYKVVRMHFENGKPTRFDDFVTGFLINNNRSQFGRPVGIAVHTDGSLLFTEDNNGVMYRVSYAK